MEIVDRYTSDEKLDMEGMWKVLREAAALDAKVVSSQREKIIKRRFGD